MQKGKKRFINNKNLVNSNYRRKNRVDWRSTKRGKNCNLKRTQKLKNITYGLIFPTCGTSLEPQKLVIFGPQLCHINHKDCRGLGILFLWFWGTPLPITHILWRKVCHHILKQINHFAWRHERCLLKHFSEIKFNHFR